MKRVLFLSVILSGSSLIVSAQSGRKIEAQPTPPPAQEEAVEDFSESKPTKLPPVYVSPKQQRELLKDRNKKAKKSDNPNNSNNSKVIEDKSGTTQTVGDGEDEITVDTNLVTLPVSVYDRNGLYIPNLQKSDFKIFENGKEQQIEVFETTDKPFTVILLIDTSPSTVYNIEEIQDAAIAFTNQLKPQDSVMVVEFDGNVSVLTEITKDRQKIHKAIKKADFGNGTALYDAVDFSLRKRLNQIEGRKAIVLFTDGVDTFSRKGSYDSTLYISQE
jgi:hypothetical protein